MDFKLPKYKKSREIHYNQTLTFSNFAIESMKTIHSYLQMLLKCFHFLTSLLCENGFSSLNQSNILYHIKCRHRYNNLEFAEK